MRQRPLPIDFPDFERTKALDIFAVYSPYTGRERKDFLRACEAPGTTGAVISLDPAAVMNGDIQSMLDLIGEVPAGLKKHLAFAVVPAAASAPFPTVQMANHVPAFGLQTISYPVLTAPSFKSWYLEAAMAIADALDDHGLFDQVHGIRHCPVTVQQGDSEMRMPSVSLVDGQRVDQTASLAALGCTDDTVISAMAEIGAGLASIFAGKFVSLTVLRPDRCDMGNHSDGGAYFNRLVDGVAAAMPKAPHTLVIGDVCAKPNLRPEITKAGLRVGAMFYQFDTDKNLDVAATVRACMPARPLWFEAHDSGQVAQAVAALQAMAVTMPAAA